MSQDEKAREALEIFEQALEAAMVQLRMNLGLDQKPMEVRLPDLGKLTWTKIEAHDYMWEGQNKHTDAYEKSLDKEKPEFQEMVKLIESKGGRTMFNGGFLVWLDKNDGSLGRRARKK